MKISVAVYFHFAFNGALQTLDLHLVIMLTVMHGTWTCLRCRRCHCNLPAASTSAACCGSCFDCAAAFEDGDRAGPIRHDLYMLVRISSSPGHDATQEQHNSCNRE
jgi:hypothetical protein